MVDLLFWYNPASHAIWIVGYLMFGVFLVGWLLDAVSLLRERLADRKRSSESQEEEPSSGLRLPHSDPAASAGVAPPRFRTWSEGRANIVPEPHPPRIGSRRTATR